MGKQYAGGVTVKGLNKQEISRNFRTPVRSKGQTGRQRAARTGEGTDELSTQLLIDLASVRAPDEETGLYL